MLPLLYFVAVTIAAYVPSDNYSTLTPSASPTGTTDYTQSFGIQIETVSAAPSAAAKREVTQIGDGQIQAPTTTTSAAVTKVINQIGDGQIQNQPTASVINQIGDGQIQNQATTATTATKVVNQIGDGQIQNQPTTSASASVINQINDGQIQNQGTAAAQITDGQVQNNSTSDDTSGAKLETCATSDSLSMSLSASILTDAKGRIGSIVANRQFQFDGPPPQAGAIYAAGWSIIDGYLALGNNQTFYQCLSGDFYNLYDQDVADQCAEVKLAIVDLISC
ncbi:hypothetical protein PSN45_004850 [Yamadazyma tenuis]|uniref:Cell wall mannoprotein PIR1-like C-terminal domain-containing protein n=1 Tax=Candida tenuis (strain ATCC 10573 / BCRC 21748 / CBS 615 / JCM 9827 / NBRC 10315 / NRRL Y-1498 / VKM Y-70) TaxID=590646 RepID=G3B1U7_CANTC|nr:uncharacterized protein CANTEDRAFT_113304 [Yamadazyma tenuis ATCC 10573]XP_006685822.1 uncharacterized protein CANTEDRAFT_113304 [Yamadazyma tenuis ATCC 10573]EGV65015.1 hypothetical protein CANTEDRAFT_113304 [Yamadazyma tenuis ATCC 10573]EGV65016.1 hypothetical protein CANTEDRAFT_113304 [Yamadazyma tenuis ATCC 10573]WEJ97300.1 hypothetical protein PSN45_004850 [Yamadazyma tenuis]